MPTSAGSSLSATSSVSTLTTCSIRSRRIVLLAHEDLHSVAAGYVPDGVLGDPSWRARMTRFHGLDAVLGDA